MQKQYLKTARPLREGYNYNDMGASTAFTENGDVDFTAYHESACNENCWYAAGPIHLQDAINWLGTEDYEVYSQGWMPTYICDTES